MFPPVSLMDPPALKNLASVEEAGLGLLIWGTGFASVSSVVG